MYFYVVFTSVWYLSSLRSKCMSVLIIIDDALKIVKSLSLQKETELQRLKKLEETFINKGTCVCYIVHSVMSFE